MAPPREVVAKPLNVITAPAHGLQVITTPASPSTAKQGNQGTALVTRKLTSFPSLYASAPSGKPSSCNTAHFRCAPRDLTPDGNGRTRLRVRVMERHPYTRQAFFPMGRDTRSRAYIVIVADDKDGKPNLDKIQAFIAMGNQGIVYEANRWHSPMCALDQTLEFAVVQHENGVSEEDTIEYYLRDDEHVDIILGEQKCKL